MEARATVTCAECGRTREVAGEIPSEYTACFAQIVAEDGFVPRPGATTAFVCGDCLRRYEGAGSESRDDAEKI
ncbi:MAG TPA: hypothetical protein VG323_02335 [Thermoanaerobaculia bacterium]|nr:hypothetical protein [Thermoanaerobaculia bacterium]